jgi:soluble lytic murein transglycosylase-like protein
VRRLRAKGVENIDVGCMQVNLYYHGDAFETLKQAFDPAANVAYAAEFLLDLREERGSWTRAIGDYHSQTPRYSGPYRLKVFRAWRKAKKAAYAEERRARQARRQFTRELAGYLRDDRPMGATADPS